VRREFTFFSAALIVAAVLLGGCGGGQTAVDTTLSTTTRDARPEFAGKPSPTFPPQLHLSYDGQVTPANVAILMAITKGFFSDVGLTVYPSSPVIPRRPVSYISAYTDDIAIAQEPQVALGKDHDASVVAVGSLVSEPTAAFIWLPKSGIDGIADLEGKTIAVPGIPYQEEMLESILESGGVDPDDVEVKTVGYRVLPALLHGQADAIFGGSWNVEGAALRARGEKPVIKRVQEFGVPSYDEVMVITRADRAAREPWVIRKFMSALTRAVRAVKRNPALASKLVQSGPHEFPLSKREIDAQVRATLPLLSASGHIDPDQASRLMTWMHSEGMIQQQPSVSELFTDKYLSGGG
jgi:putative hydroxymethylpyrimidine transport system substrate-binding protein